MGADRFECDLSNPDQVRELHRTLAGGDELVGGVLNFLALSSASRRGLLDDVDAPLRLCEQTFNVLKEFEEDLRATSQEGGGWFFNFTAMDGKFGLDNADAESLVAAGTLGIAKSFQREAPKARVKTVDIDPSLPAPTVAGLLLEELSADDGLLEVGLSRQGRFRLRLKKDPAPTNLSALPIAPGSVVLVTGGAFGVTADVAIALSQMAQPTLILVGRSPLPTEESPQTNGLSGSALRTKLIEQARARGEKFTPAEIEKRLARIAKDRSIRANLDAAQRAGATIEYHAIDVRDSASFGALIDDLYRRFGRIDGVIHGAGVIEDKRIKDKTPASFANVFGTKVSSALTLVQKLRPESLEFLVFFSSVSGRFGNAGQTDYSAANEFLNKLANHLDRIWPARVVSINWGPWDGGMVTDDLRRLYAQVGFEMIPIAEGVRSLTEELRLPEWQSPEVVISCSVDKMASDGFGIH